MKFSFDEPAIIDVGDIVDYYSIIRRRLAVRFIEELYGRIRLVCENPRMGLSMDDRFRQVLLNDFPYAVVYEIDQATNTVHVTAVRHQQRSPGYRRNRVQEEPAIYQLAA
jgi:plasmid stabilization system protein ParE